MQRTMMLVCHAADGHFADGNREGIRRVLARTACVMTSLGQGWYEIVCSDGGRFGLYAPGLDRKRPFHRMEVTLGARSRTSGVVRLLLELMQAGGFGLMDSLNASQVIVTSPQQLVYFPWLPEPPLLIRSPRDLAASIGYPAL